MRRLGVLWLGAAAALGCDQPARERSTTAISRDGVVRWWVDGQLAGDYATVNFDQRRFVEFQFAPTWGGIGQVKRQSDYFRFGPVRLSHQ
jgi:hypothetical protein